LPDIDDELAKTINENTNNTAIIGGTTSLHNLTVNAGKTFTIDANVTATTITNSGIIDMNATTDNLIGDVTNTGTITVSAGTIVGALSGTGELNTTGDFNTSGIISGTQTINVSNDTTFAVEDNVTANTIALDTNGTLTMNAVGVVVDADITGTGIIDVDANSTISDNTVNASLIDEPGFLKDVRSIALVVKPFIPIGIKVDSPQLVTKRPSVTEWSMFMSWLT